MATKLARFSVVSEAQMQGAHPAIDESPCCLSSQTLHRSPVRAWKSTRRRGRDRAGMLSCLCLSGRKARAMVMVLCRPPSKLPRRVLTVLTTRTAAVDFSSFVPWHYAWLRLAAEAPAALHQSQVTQRPWNLVGVSPARQARGPSSSLD